MIVAPLSDEDLVRICQMSDERPVDQVLVMPVDQVAPPYALDRNGLYANHEVPGNYNYGYHRYVTIYMWLQSAFLTHTRIHYFTVNLLLRISDNRTMPIMDRLQ